MATQTFVTVRKVKRMDECAREAEQQAHDEMIINARRASKKAQRAVRLANTLVDEINEVL